MIAARILTLVAALCIAMILSTAWLQVEQMRCDAAVRITAMKLAASTPALITFPPEGASEPERPSAWEQGGPR